MFNADTFDGNLVNEGLNFHEEKCINCGSAGCAKQFTNNISLAYEALDQRSRHIKEDAIQLKTDVFNELFNGLQENERRQ